MTDYSMQVNTNGMLSFGFSFGDYIPQTFPLSYVQPYALIALYWDDHDVRGKGQIYYRFTKDEVLLDSVGSNISFAFNTSFSPTWLFIATWDEVVEYLGNSNSEV